MLCAPPPDKWRTKLLWRAAYPAGLRALRGVDFSSVASTGSPPVKPATKVLDRHEQGAGEDLSPPYRCFPEKPLGDAGQF
jgi:hypothetical protein